MVHPQDTGTTATRDLVLNNLYDIVDAIRELKQAEFTIAPAKDTAKFVAVLERNGFRVRVTLNLLKADQHVGLSRIGVDGEFDGLRLAKGRFRRDDWVPFDMPAAVHEALRWARKVGAQR